MWQPPSAWLALVLLAGCAPQAVASSSGTGTTVAARDTSGDLILARGARPTERTGAGWLDALLEGDVLSYRVRVGDGEEVVARQRIARLVRRGESVAALLWPDPSSSAFGVDLAPHWLAGDGEALYRLPSDPELADPGIVPLDASGRVIADARGAALWRVPHGWRDAAKRDPAESWTAEELSLLVEGPVRGDHCLGISHAGPEPTRIVVCASVGLVELRRGPEEAPTEVRELVQITRPASPSAR